MTFPALPLARPILLIVLLFASCLPASDAARYDPLALPAGVEGTEGDSHFLGLVRPRLPALVNLDGSVACWGN